MWGLDPAAINWIQGCFYTPASGKGFRELEGDACPGWVLAAPCPLLEGSPRGWGSQPRLTRGQPWMSFPPAAETRELCSQRASCLLPPPDMHQGWILLQPPFACPMTSHLRDLGSSLGAASVAHPGEFSLPPFCFAAFLKSRAKCRFCPH